MPRIFTVTVSDTRTVETDTSGPAMAEELSRNVGCDVVRHLIVPDDAAVLEKVIRDNAASGAVDAIVLSGGTGIAPRDVSYEAVSALFDKPLDGFGEAFRRLSWDEIGPRAILSRAAAGTVGSCLVFLLPGSENGARLGTRALIGPILGHAVDLVNGRTHHGTQGKK